METHCMRWTQSRHAFPSPPAGFSMSHDAVFLSVRTCEKKTGLSQPRDYDDDDDEHGGLCFCVVGQQTCRFFFLIAADALRT